MVLSGQGLSLIPGLPKVAFAPESVLPVFLPRLLFPAVFLNSWHDFKSSRQPIGLVFLTMAVVTWVTMPSFPIYPGRRPLFSVPSSPRRTPSPPLQFARACRPYAAPSRFWKVRAS